MTQEDFVQRNLRKAIEYLAEVVEHDREVGDQESHAERFAQLALNACIIGTGDTDGFDFLDLELEGDA